MDNAQTKRTTVQAIMRSAAFKAGVADARAGRGFRPEYEKGIGKRFACDLANWQWDYERGRQWARLAPTTVRLTRDGKITRAAMRFFSRDIL